MAGEVDANARRTPATQEDIKRAVRNRDPKDLSWNQVMRFVFRLMARHPFLVAAAAILTIGLAMAEIFAFSLFFPFIETLMAGDGGTGSGLGDTPLGFLIPFFAGMTTVEVIRILAGLLFATELVKASMVYGLTRVAQYMHIVISRDLRITVFDEILRTELRFLDKEKTSNLFTILHSFPNAAARIVDELMKGLQNGTSFIALVVTLLLLNWQLTLVAGGLALVVNLIVIQLSHIVRRRAKAITKTRLELHRMTLETLQALKVVHLFGRGRHTRGQFTGKLQNHQDKQYAKAKISSLLSPLHSVLNSVLVALVLVAATFILVRDAAYWVALLTVFMAVVFKFMGKSGKYAKRRAAIAGEIPAVEAVIDFLERDKPLIKDGTRRFDGLTDKVVFDAVRFRYDSGDDEAVKGVSFTVPRGRMVALVGGSGAGKSTLIDLLGRIYDPSEGRIVVDGQDLKGIRLDDWRRRLAVVSQSSFLFNTSIRDNIRYGRLGASDDEVEQAARHANAHRFIMDLPHGYDTNIGDRGVRLSGGQAQRLAIARAILADPDILVLDEATSALDTETEFLVQQAIDKVSQDRTIVAIAHRLSTIRKADEILVLEDGQIVERGDHKTLLEKEGRYWRYVQMQSLDLDEEVDLVALGVHGADTVLEHEEVLTARPAMPPDTTAHERLATTPAPMLVRLAEEATPYLQTIQGLEGVTEARASGKRIHLLVQRDRGAMAAVLRALLDAGATPLAFGKKRKVGVGDTPETDGAPSMSTVKVKVPEPRRK